MATRLHLSLGTATWTAKVARHDVSLGDGALQRVSTHDGRLQVTGGDRTHSGNAVASGDEVWVTVDGEVFVFQVTHGTRGSHAASAGQDAFSPPMAATVVRIAVKPGDRVEDGDVLIALEAMKMELPIRAPRAGVVRAVHCREGELVQPGQVLIDFE
jgi:3-methylcrotonyl-CoA carboxylase alpha subunit